MKIFRVYPTRIHWLVIVPLAFFIALPFISFVLASKSLEIERWNRSQRVIGFDTTRKELR